MGPQHKVYLSLSRVSNDIMDEPSNDARKCEGTKEPNMKLQKSKSLFHYQYMMLKHEGDIKVAQIKLLGRIALAHELRALSILHASGVLKLGKAMSSQ